MFLYPHKFLIVVRNWKMVVTWITINKKLLKGSAVINAAPLEIFNNILHLISESGEISEDHLTEFNKTLNYSDEDLQYLVQSILHIYKKSSMIVMKPNMLQKQLEQQLQFHTDKAEAFVKVWTKSTKEHFGDLDKRKKLDAVSWSLYLKTHSSDNPPGARMLEPTARLQLSLSDFDKQNSEETTLDLDVDGLRELYRTLENIQEKIDNVNAMKS